MENQLHRLKQINNNSYDIDHKVTFGSPRYRYEVSKEKVLECLEFCWNMAFNEEFYHRPNRSNGKKKRNNIEIFKDAFVGKIGEVVLHQMCVERDKCTITNVDFKCAGKAVWDDSDFFIESKDKKKFKIAVKTTKHFGNLLLLETKDWEIKDNKVIYNPNGDEAGFYDFMVFCRVKARLEGLKEADLKNFSNLNQIASSIKVEGEVVGYLRNEHLVSMIQNGYILPQGSQLNKNTSMDAENYYIQSGSMLKIPEN